MANISDLASILAKEMSAYVEEITGVVKEAVDITAKEVNQEIKNKVRFKVHRGRYVKSFRVKKIYEDGYSKKVIWHVANGEHRLTHLLENGHALNNGGRAKAYPHIKYGEELAKRRMEELVAEGIENVSRR